MRETGTSSANVTGPGIPSAAACSGPLTTAHSPVRSGFHTLRSHAALDPAKSRILGSSSGAENIPTEQAKKEASSHLLNRSRNEA